MNLNEFKAWFEGFTENINGVPSKKQWARITAKVSEIKDAPPTSYPVYIDRWVRPYWHQYWQPYGGIGLSMQSTTATGGLSAQCNNALGEQHQSYLGMQCAGNSNSADSANWNSFDAFRDLGRAEAHSLNS